MHLLRLDSFGGYLTSPGGYLTSPGGYLTFSAGYFTSSGGYLVTLERYPSCLSWRSGFFYRVVKCFSCLGAAIVPPCTYCLVLESDPSGAAPRSGPTVFSWSASARDTWSCRLRCAYVVLEWIPTASSFMTSRSERIKAGYRLQCITPERHSFCGWLFGGYFAWGL